MGRDILDLIDNAIAGATSDDAMRWKPPGTTMTGLRPDYLVVAQCWTDPQTQREWAAPLGTPQPTSAADLSPFWVPLGALLDLAADLSTASAVTAAAHRSEAQPVANGGAGFADLALGRPTRAAPAGQGAARPHPGWLG